MANNHGTAILSFGTGARAAVTKTEQVITDSAPNPHDWPIRSVTKGGFYTNNNIRYLGSSHWVITTNNNATYYSLNDGVSWTQGSNTAGNDGWSISSSNSGTALIVGGSSALASTYIVNAGAWGLVTGGNLPQLANWSAPVHNGISRWVTLQLGVSGNVAAYSDNNGSTWTSFSTMAVKTYSGIIWDGTYYIAVASVDSYRSADGVTVWDAVGNFGVSGGWTGICSDSNGTTIVFRTTNSAVWYTKNHGDTWTEVILPISFSGITCRYLNGCFIGLVGDATGIFIRSYDGIEWTIHRTVQAAGNTLNNFDYNPTSGKSFIIESTTGSGNPFKLWTSIGNIPYNGSTRTLSNKVIEVEPAMSAVGTNTAVVSVTGQTALLATDSIDAWIQANDSTSSHNAIEHKLAPIKLSVTNIVPGTGFDIVGISDQRLSGDFKVRWAWAS